MRASDHIPVETLTALIEQSELHEAVLVPVMPVRPSTPWAGKLAVKTPMSLVINPYIDHDMFRAGLKELVTEDN